MFSLFVQYHMNLHYMNLSNKDNHYKQLRVIHAYKRKKKKNKT